MIKNIHTHLDKYDVLSVEHSPLFSCVKDEDLGKEFGETYSSFQELFDDKFR